MNLMKLSKNDLMMLFENEFGREALRSSIRRKFKKEDYSEAISDINAYVLNITDDKEVEGANEMIKKKWQSRCPNMLDAFERFL